MKQIILTIAITLCLAFSVSAKNDRFFNDWSDFDSRELNFPDFPDIHGSIYNSNLTPIDGGLLILTAFGAGYVMTRRRGREHR